MEMQVLPRELSEAIESGWFEENGDIELTNLVYDEGVVTIQFVLHSGDDTIPNQLWEIHISGLQLERISDRWQTQMSFHIDHFLLWEFIDEYTSLYFNGQTENPDGLLAEIFQMHSTRFRNKFDMGKYLNTCIGFRELCSSEFGLFATGPKKILEHYFYCLEKYNKNPHYQASTYNSLFDEGQLGLLLIGDTYFIGEHFTFRHVH